MQIAKIVPYFLFITLHAACTAEDAADDTANTAGETPSIGTLQLESINQLVAITDPVAPFPSTDTSASALAALNFNQLNINAGLKATADQGVSLGSSTSSIGSAFTTASGSKAFCETVNNGMKFFKEASNSDFNLCILKKATSDLSLKNSGFQTWDYKGTSSYGAFTYRIKFSLEATDDGGLKKFESFTCMAMGTGSLSQSGYALQTITDGKLAIHARVQSDQGVAPVIIRTDVTGEVNADGRPVGLKSIDYAESSDDRSVHTKVIQSAENIQAIGYENSNGRVTQSLSFVELLDKNAASGQYFITKLAYGDGAAITRITASGTTTNNTASWNGDTLVLNSSEPRRAKVFDRQSEFISPTGDDLDVDFSTAETYDCAGTADETITLSETDVAACMEAFEIDQNGSTMCNGLSY